MKRGEIDHVRKFVGLSPTFSLQDEYEERQRKREIWIHNHFKKVHRLGRKWWQEVGHPRAKARRIGKLKINTEARRIENRISGRWGSGMRSVRPLGVVQASRNALLKAIEASPGARFNELQKTFPQMALRCDLKWLENQGLIKGTEQPRGNLFGGMVKTYARTDKPAFDWQPHPARAKAYAQMDELSFLT